MQDETSISVVWARGRMAYERLDQAMRVPLLPLRPTPNATGPMIALLVTFPHSGTTWTKQLFGRASGIASESVYKEDLRPDCANRIGVTKGMRGVAHSWSVRPYCKKTYYLLGCEPCSTATTLWAQGTDAPALVKSHQQPGPPNSAVPSFSSASSVEVSRSWLPWNGIAASVTPSVVVRLVREPLEQAVASCERRVPCRGVPYSSRIQSTLSAIRCQRRARDMKSCLMDLNKTVVQYVKWHCAVAMSAREAAVPLLTIDYGRMKRQPAQQLRRLLGFLSSSIKTRGVTNKAPWSWSESNMLAAVKAFPSLQKSEIGGDVNHFAFDAHRYPQHDATPPSAAAVSWLSPHDLAIFWDILDEAITATPYCKSVLQHRSSRRQRAR